MELLLPGLPSDLIAVPAMPKSDLDPAIPLLQEQWLEWAEQVLRYRLEVWERCTQKIAGINRQDMQDIELEKIRRYGTPYFSTIWLSTYETRKNEKGLILGGDWKPFIPYSFQVWFWTWLEDRSNATGEDRNGWARKSRDMGITECCCKRALTKWLFDRPYSAKFISRHEDLVYQDGNPDSIFERITPFLKPSSEVLLPEFLLPRGFIYEEHKHQKTITRPDNRNIISGESSGSRSGRGGRSGEAFVDEASFIRNLRLIAGSLFMTAPTVIFVSSESVEVSEEFGDMVDAAQQENPDAVISLETHLHPFHDDEWKEQTRKAYRLAGREDAYFREVLMQRHAGLTDYIYPDARSIRPMEGPKEYEPGNLLIAGIDPGKADDTALGWFEVDPTGPHDFCLDGYINRSQLPEYYAALLLGCDPDDPAILEEFPRFVFGERERHVMEWTRSLPQPVVYGDPMGSASWTKQGDDWYTRMLIFSRTYNPRKDEDGRGKPLVIITKWKEDARAHQVRHNALNEWIGRLQFAGTSGARRIHYAIAHSKFKNATMARISEQVEPEHDELSHPRSMAEYVAVNIDPIRRSGARKQSRDTVIVRSATRSRDAVARDRQPTRIDPMAKPELPRPARTRP